jgi:hypothetical protein
MREAFTPRRSARAEGETDPLPRWLATVRQLAPLIRHPVGEAERQRRLSPPEAEQQGRGGGAV